MYNIDVIRNNFATSAKELESLVERLNKAYAGNYDALKADFGDYIPGMRKDSVFTFATFGNDIKLFGTLMPEATHVDIRDIPLHVLETKLAEKEESRSSYKP